MGDGGVKTAFREAEVMEVMTVRQIERMLREIKEMQDKFFEYAINDLIIGEYERAISNSSLYARIGELIPRCVHAFVQEGKILREEEEGEQ